VLSAIRIERKVRKVEGQRKYFIVEWVHPNIAAQNWDERRYGKPAPRDGFYQVIHTVEPDEQGNCNWDEALTLVRKYKRIRDSQKLDQTHIDQPTPQDVADKMYQAMMQAYEEYEQETLHEGDDDIDYILKELSVGLRRTPSDDPLSF
jgi:hypothetical protein